VSEDILADRLKSEPPVLGGLTNSDLNMVASYGSLFWGLICVPIAAILGKAMLGVAVAVVLLLLTFVVCSKLFQQMKRGRPDSYLAHKMALRKKTNTNNNDYLKYSGDWSLGRVDDDR